MDNITTYREVYWNLHKSPYAEVDNLPLMQGPTTVVMVIVVYLAFVLKFGPAFMEKRESYKLKTVMLIYNAVQVIHSAYLVQRFFRDVFLDYGLAPTKCIMAEEESRNQVIIGTWLYLAGKFTELLDTVFFVLRKKYNQVTFLHLYHHSIMVIGTWAVLKYWATHTMLYIGFINSLVHVFMYTYYGLAGLGPKVAKYLTWKKYMTTFQLVQFVSIIVVYLTAVNSSECPPSKGFNTFITGNTAFFLLLFCNFYRQAYITKKKKL